MKINKHAVSLLLAFLLTAFTLMGCSNKVMPQEDSAQTAATEEPVVAAAEETTEEPAVTDTQSDAATREITDMAGRSITIPTKINSVFSTGPAAAIYLYTLVPDKLLGWNYELNDVEKSILLEKYQTLPNFGMGDAVNYEAVIAAGPDIALNVGTINDKMISDCDSLSESLGIPVIAVDGDLLASPEAYLFMGELFDAKEQAQLLADYAKKTFTDLETMNIPEDKKVRMYYGNGETSLETAPAGSSHTQLIDLVKAVNVADLELGDGSRVEISAEQLLAWDPDVIVVNGEPKSNLSGCSAADSILTNPDYASLKAVKNGQVYGTPNAPFNWVDRPPGPNRIIGIRWLSGLIYPDYLSFNVDDEVREFFRLFYHVELTDEQLDKLYKGIV